MSQAPPSIWDSPNWTDIADWKPEYNIIPDLDEPKSVYLDYVPDPRDTESFPATALDNLPIEFGKKYPNKTPIQILALDPQYIVWCRENTSRVFCSDELYKKAQSAPKSRW